MGQRFVLCKTTLVFSRGLCPKHFLDHHRVDESAEVPSPPSSPGSLDSPGSVHPLLKVEASVASSEGRQILQQIHEEGIKRLAELCTCCMDGLLQVGKSLKQEQAGQETMDWPKGCEETSNLLRGYTVRLVHDLEAVAGAYVEALLGKIMLFLFVPYPFMHVQRL